MQRRCAGAGRRGQGGRAAAGQWESQDGGAAGLRHQVLHGDPVPAAGKPSRLCGAASHWFIGCLVRAPRCAVSAYQRDSLYLSGRRALPAHCARSLASREIIASRCSLPQRVQKQMAKGHLEAYPFIMDTVNVAAFLGQQLLPPSAGACMQCSDVLATTLCFRHMPSMVRRSTSACPGSQPAGASDPNAANTIEGCRN